ncbi:class E vacuolar protein-sorting machinery protein HSE1 [Scheffersomyces xylosifermentans]|uniref:class E vacuolar protein-sorting machinery protein HSE1 n=1 Tax=Scheffersomyces xylosifermentans TaxID=1304137 RepID=UPI00315DF2F6
MYKSRRSYESSSLESLIKRATDETLTTENWEYILEVCDKVKSDPENATKQAIGFITKRLETKDANVVLRTLELLLSLGENCGSRMQQEIATDAFTKVLLKKLKDRKLHETVKIRIAQVIDQLHTSFKSDPSLKPMTDAYNKVRSEHPRYLNSKDTPNKPEKRELVVDASKEEEELQRVMNLSLQEYERQEFLRKQLNEKPLPDPSKAKENQSNNKEKEQPAISKVRAIFDLVSHEQDELSFKKGDIITVVEKAYRDWWRGSLSTGETGIFPLNYVTPIYNKSPEEVAQELQLEDRLLNVEQKKIDRLLALLSAASSGHNDNIDDEELETLYGQVSGLRSQLGTLIVKHTVREKELKTLNDQLGVEDKAYHDLLNKSISQINSSYAHNPQDIAPYPTGGHSTGIPQFQGYPDYSPTSTAPLREQPTSVGFGNSIYSQPQIHQQQPQQQPPQDYSQFSNINRFPEVNNMQ